MKRIAQALGIAVIALAAAACSGGAAPATAGPSQPGPSGDAVVVVAKDLKFDVSTISVKAGTPTTIILDNQENVPHNIAIKDAAGETVFKGEIVSAKQVSNAVPALAAGSYPFWCEIHPDMQGTLEAK